MEENNQKRKRERVELKAKPICGDCLLPIDICAHKIEILEEIRWSAERLIELAKEREELTK
jgi:hypothetical protein